MTNAKTRTINVSIPVQCTILVPMEFEIDADLSDAVGESVDGYDFVSLDSIPEGASVAVELVRQAMGMDDVRAALSALAIGASEYKEANPGHKIKVTPYAGIVPESDI